MSLTHENEPGDLLASYPDFELSCRFDASDEPEELTVFAGDEVGDSLTQWLTVDTVDAVSLDEVR